MSEQYTRIHTLPENLYLSGAPILISAGALLKHNQNNKVLAQLKLKNLSQTKLIACKVSIRAFDPSGTELPAMEDYSYLDLSIPCGEEFGTKQPIYLKDNTTRRFSVAVVQAVFEDGEVWQHPAAEWKPVFKSRRLIADMLPDIKLQEQYALEVGGNCKYIPTTEEGLTICTCGNINLSSSKVCSKCKRDIEGLLSSLDLNELTRKKDARLEKAEQERLEKERKRLEEEQKKRAAAAARKRKIKRTVKWAAIAVTAMMIIGIASFFAVKQYQYNTAEKLLAARDYNGAIEAFTALGKYRDSAERAEDVPYQKAEAFLADKNYIWAISTFRSLGSYKDSAERATDAAYLQAENLLDNEKHEEAIKAFQALGDYKDSSNLLLKAQEALYEESISLLEQKNYKDAFSNFSISLKTYKDSSEQAEKIVDIVYADAFKSYNNGEYLKAYEEFTSIKEANPVIIDNRVTDKWDDCAFYRNLNFKMADDGKAYNLAKPYSKIVAYKDGTLKNELLNTPQMQMVSKLEGEWVYHAKNSSVFYYLSIHNGEILYTVEGVGMSYKSKHQYVLCYCNGKYQIWADYHSDDYITKVSDTSLTRYRKYDGKFITETYKKLK